MGGNRGLHHYVLFVAWEKEKGGGRVCSVFLATSREGSVVFACGGRAGGEKWGLRVRWQNSGFEIVFA